MAEFEQHHIATLVGFRIATHAVLQRLLVEVFGNRPDGIRELDEYSHFLRTALEGCEYVPVGAASAEFIKHHALESLDGILASVPSQIRTLREQ